jgi:type I restriction enzyme M protein
MPANHTELEKRLWDAANELRANSKLKSSEYSVPVLGLIFVRYADQKFAMPRRRSPRKGADAGVLVQRQMESGRSRLASI